MTEFYSNSKGQPVRIADMFYPHLENAHAKLVRDQKDGERQDEIDAMAARLAELAEQELDAQVSE